MLRWTILLVHKCLPAPYLLLLTRITPPPARWRLLSLLPVRWTRGAQSAYVVAITYYPIGLLVCPLEKVWSFGHQDLQDLQPCQAQGYRNREHKVPQGIFGVMISSLLLLLLGSLASSLWGSVLYKRFWFKVCNAFWRKLPHHRASPLSWHFNDIISKSF